MPTLTEWWITFENNLNKISGDYPELLANHVPLKSALKMAKIGAKIESASILKKSGYATDIEKESKNLGYPVKGYKNKPYYLPYINFPADILFAIVYQEHLEEYKNIQSTDSNIQHGFLLIAGIEAYKEANANCADILKQKIKEYLDNKDNITLLKMTFPKLAELNHLSIFDGLRFIAGLKLSAHVVSSTTQPIGSTPVTETQTIPTPHEHKTIAPIEDKIPTSEVQSISTVSPITQKSSDHDENRLSKKHETPTDTIQIDKGTIKRKRKKLIIPKAPLMKEPITNLSDKHAAPQSFEEKLGESIHQLFEENVIPSADQLLKIDKELEKIVHILTKIQQCENVIKIIQKPTDDLLKNHESTQEELKQVEFYFDSAIQTQISKLKNYLNKHSVKKITEHPPLNFSTHTSEEEQKLLTNPSRFKLWQSTVQVSKAIIDYFGVHSSTAIPSLQNNKVALYRNTEDETDEINHIFKETSMILEHQLTLLNTKKTHFKISDVRALSTENLDQLIEKTSLLREITHTDKRVTKYIHENSGKLIPQFLNKIFSAIYSSNHQFLKKYFLPEQWKCTYEAQQLRGYLASVKDQLVEPDNEDITLLKNQFRKRLQKTITNLETNQFSFFSTSKIDKLKTTLNSILEKEYSKETPKTK